MKITRSALKSLIVETIRDNGSILLEMPEEVPYEKSQDGHKEGAMSKKELFHMSQKAGQLHDMLADDEELEPWVQSKVTKAASMVAAVFDHLMYEKRPGHIKE